LGLVAGKSEDVRADTHRTHRTKGNNAVFRRTVGFRNSANLTRCADTRERNRALPHQDGANRAVCLDTCDVNALADNDINGANSTRRNNSAYCYRRYRRSRPCIAIRMKARNQREGEWVNVV
jgi:hypothetical protein